MRAGEPMLSLRLSIALLCLGALSLLCGGPANAREFSVLLPDQPTRDQDNANTPLDVLFALADPFALAGTDIDMPQMLAVLRALPANGDETDKKAKPMVEREELLGGIEEIRYADKKAWATHVALDTPALYTLIAESRPRWDEERGLFQQHFVKTALPVKGVERGWEFPVRMKFEIVPTTRPFGLMAPALFSGKVLLDNAPQPGCLVHIARMNTEKRGLPTAWHAVQVARTDDTGAFAFVCPLPGWWGFMAVAHGDPLKGPDVFNVVWRICRCVMNSNLKAH